MSDASPFRRVSEAYRWEGVDIHAYKAEGSAPFKDITRQTLFADPRISAELRYFEMAPGGHSTLERHEHMHAVMIFRGAGRCLVGDKVFEVAQGDLISIPPMIWHQFRAGAGEHLGFLCMVDRVRDKPQLPTAEQLDELAGGDPSIAEFLRKTG